jgi:hypothetical protein
MHIITTYIFLSYFIHLFNVNFLYSRVIIVSTNISGGSRIFIVGGGGRKMFSLGIFFITLQSVINQGFLLRNAVVHI